MTQDLEEVRILRCLGCRRPRKAGNFYTIITLIYSLLDQGFDYVAFIEGEVDRDVGVNIGIPLAELSCLKDAFAEFFPCHSGRTCLWLHLISRTRCVERGSQRPAERAFLVMGIT